MFHSWHSNNVFNSADVYVVLGILDMEIFLTCPECTMLNRNIYYHLIVP